METQQLEYVTTKIMSQRNKPELAQYLHAELSAQQHKPPQGKQERFPDDLDRTHRKSHQGSYQTINGKNNATHEKDKKFTTNNQRETFRHRPGIKEQKNVVFVQLWTLLQQRRGH